MTVPKLITPLHQNYPSNLKQLVHPPSSIYLLGKLKAQDSLAVAVVGTRQMTAYGRQITKHFVKNLIKHQVTIVSGLARGVDTIAHQAALNHGGRTIAVLGSGIDTIYPPENAALAKAILKNGALISEFPPGTKPLGPNFLARNRIISALSRAVLVIEGARRSGTLSTATHAANQGREVFAIPGPLSSKQSQAPLYLIEQGAQIATSPQDILDAIL